MEVIEIHAASTVFSEQDRYSCHLGSLLCRAGRTSGTCPEMLQLLIMVE